MTKANPDSIDTTWTASFTDAKREALFEFADTTPDQKIAWLGQMLELLTSLRTKEGPANEK